MGVLVHTETLALELEYFLLVKTIKSKAWEVVLVEVKVNIVLEA
jgi:hypothetical protein